MNIIVDLNYPIKDGTEVVFRSPVDCSQVKGLLVNYQDNGPCTKEFALADANGNNVGKISHLFAEDVPVKVILDVTKKSMAFVQNADTNAYLEGRFAKLEAMIGTGGGSGIVPITGDELDYLATVQKLVAGTLYLVTEDSHDSYMKKGDIWYAVDQGSPLYKGNISGSTDSAVLYTEQELTGEQQAQARENIGIDIVEVVESVNLFNKDSAENKSGYLMNRGKEVAISGYGYSHPIAVQDGNTYYVTKSGDVSANYVATFYDANGVALKGTTTGNTTTATIGIDATDEYWYFTIPDGLGASYMLCSYKEAKIDAFMVAETDVAPTGYMPHGEGKTVVKDSALPLLVRTINGAKPDENGNFVADITSPLNGKKLALNGDSICYGAGATGGYGAYIAANNNMTLQNIGVSGGTITAEVYREDGSMRHCISRTIANMDADADYAIVEGGVNDSSLAVPLGAITADYGDTLDDTTFYGAFESMLKQLLIRFAGKKVGYIAVHQMSANFRVSNDKETSYYWAAKLCCEKWGVPFLDLNTTVPPFGLIRNTTAQADLYAATRAAYTANADGWHPNEEGYKKYYVPKIEAWLKTL